MSGPNANDSYRLCVVRRASLPDPADLTATIDWLVRELEQQDPALFSLSGYSPAMEAVPVLEGERSRVGAFLATSEIEWNFGRDPVDPTHEVALFNTDEGARLVYLRVSFVAGGAASTGPGLVAELRLGREAAGPAGPERGAYIDKLFSMLVAAVHPDFGHVELPGHPSAVERPQSYQVGWLTYFAHAERALPPDLPPPAVAVPTELGTKIFATPSLALDNQGDVARDVAREIDRVRDALAFRPQEAALAPQPAQAPAVQVPTFMAQPPPPPLRETTALDIKPGSIRPDPLPFVPTPKPPDTERGRRFDGTPFRPSEPPPPDSDPEDRKGK